MRAARGQPRSHRHRPFGPALTDKSEIELHDPADMSDVVKVAKIKEPWIKATILTPDDYLGAILKPCQDRRGVQVDLNYVGKRAMVIYELPLNEVVFDLYDRLRSPRATPRSTISLSTIARAIWSRCRS